MCGKVFRSSSDSTSTSTMIPRGTTVSPNVWCAWWKVIKYSLRAFIRDLRGFANNVREVYKNVGDNSKNLRRFLEKVQRFSRNLPRFLRKVQRFLGEIPLSSVRGRQCPELHLALSHPPSSFLPIFGTILHLFPRNNQAKKQII